MQDPFGWLEEVEGDLASAWVDEQNAETARWLATDERHAALKARILAVLDAPDQPLFPRRRRDRFYDFRQDARHPRGLWRRTTLEHLRTRCLDDADADRWEAVLDLDALAAAEGIPWTYAGADSLAPDHRRCLVRLSRGGADAVEVREFDLVDRCFVDGGFRVPEAKTRCCWLDRDTLLIGTDLGPGTLTHSGYPREVRRWRRDTPLAEAERLFAGDEGDVQVVPFVDHTPGFHRTFVWRVTSFHQTTLLLEREGRLVPLPVPPSSQTSVWREHCLIRLSEDWSVGGEVHVAGALLVTGLEALLAGTPTFQTLFVPTERSSLEGWTSTRSLLVLTILDDVKSRVVLARPGPDGFVCEPLTGLPAHATISVDPEQPDEDDVVWIRCTDFLTPTSTRRTDLASGASEDFPGAAPRFDASPYAIEQHHATSADGTRIPYFQVARRDLRRTGDHPTLVYGYGGFEISLTPAYSPSVGLGWLEAGGVYVVANLRGGGEFGPTWHRAALRENRPKAYEDFEAVVVDLIDRGVTRAGRVAAKGGSNGGLLVGNLLVRRPELYGAIVCSVPLLDLKRYHLLLAGRSWVEEYGDPEVPEDWKFLEGFSPYHRVRGDRRYPPVLFVTSTRDDRVHPGHARKMVARMRWMGHDVHYLESREGGHAAGSTNDQRAGQIAAEWVFVQRRLRVDDTPGSEGE